MNAEEARAFVAANRPKSGRFSEFKYWKDYIAHSFRPLTCAIYWVVTSRPLIGGLAIWKAADLFVWFFRNYHIFSAPAY